MGFIQSLIDKGIEVLDNSDANLQKLGQRLGYMPLSWRQVVSQNKSRDGLMWRIPDPEVVTASSFSRIQGIEVARNELVMVFLDGKSEFVDVDGKPMILPPNYYDIQRMVKRRGEIQVVWFTTREFTKFRWAVVDVQSRDGVPIVARGYYRAAITDPYAFYKEVAGNEQVITEEKWNTHAKDTVSKSIRNIIASKQVEELQQAQPEFQNACCEALAQDFAKWGMRFIAMTVEAIVLPDEMLQANIQRKIMITDKRSEISVAEVDVQLAQLEAQKAQYAIMLEAQKIRLLGQARVDVMQSQSNIGLDPVELERLKAIEILAMNPSEGVMMDSRPQIVSQLMPPPAAPPPVNPMIIAGPSFLVPPQEQAPNVINATPPNTSPAAASASGEAMSREKIQEMLDKLDERFANGEISEQVYLTLQDKWEKRLEKLL